MTRKEAIKKFNELNFFRSETREKAIKVFEDMKKGIFPWSADEYFDMAIKALKQEPKFIVKSDGTIEQIKNCNDCLSKKELEKIGKMISDVLEKQPEQEPKTTTYYTNEKGQKVQVEYDIYDTARISRDLLEIYLEAGGFRKCGE